MTGLLLALTWLTVLPARTTSLPLVDPRSAAGAIRLAPLVGGLLGVLASALLAAAHHLAVPALLAGFLVVGALALATRGLHLDGLADTADGLGCYGPPERALAVMRDGGTGPFAVVSLIVILGAQAAALAALAVTGRWLAVVLGVAAGRAAFTWCCRRGVPPARSDGLGATVAGSQPVAVPIGWVLVLAAGAVFAIPGRPWQGPLAIGLAALAVIVLSAHTRRRFGGVSGDVLGAACEVASTVVLVTSAGG